MSLLIITNEERSAKAWKKALEEQHPGMNIYVYPEEHDTEEVEFALAWKHPRGLFKNYPNLKVIASMGAGVDHIISDPELPEKVIITKVEDKQLALDMSVYVLSIVLSHLRHLYQYQQQEQEQAWEREQYLRINDVTIGIMGMGSLGSTVGKILANNGFNVQGLSKSSKDIEGIKSYNAGEFDDFLEKSDILVCLLPLTDDTKNILNEELFTKLPKNAYVINVARGEHLSESDLIQMIDSGHLSGATLDVFKKEPLPEDHPFWKHPKIRVTPHIASMTKPASVAAQIVENYERMKEEEPLENTVTIEKGY